MRRVALLTLGAVLLAGAGVPRWNWRLPAGLSPPPVPADNPMSAARVELGRRLFYDADLSADGTMSCSTCHEQRHGFADSNRTRPGVHGDPGRRNAPALANVAWRPMLTWADPDMKGLEKQVSTPLEGEHPVEMGMKGAEAELARRLGRGTCYRRMFARAFPAVQGRIDMTSVAYSLAAFQRSLVSADSPWDRWRRSEAGARTPLGEAAFRTKCGACHGGNDLTDDRFHRVAREDPSPTDRGLAETTGLTADEGKFRTPSLRNVAVSAPYFHDGASPTLESAILRHRDLSLADGELAALTGFLGALTDAAFLSDKRHALPDKACGKPL